jgi:hypothetical protein
MAPRKNAARPARDEQPDDLADKRPALSVAAGHATDATEADVEVADGDDERTRITLHTDNGSGDFWVPPMNTWRAQARSALMTRGDSLFWAAKTLTADEAIRWAELDPSADETEPFFAEFMRRTGVAGNRAQRRNGRIA